MSTNKIAQPEKFSYCQPDQWPKWIRCFERFCQALGLAEKSDESKINTLIYCMGTEAEDILASFGLTDEDSKKYMIW